MSARFTTDTPNVAKMRGINRALRAPDVADHVLACRVGVSGRCRRGAGRKRALTLDEALAQARAHNRDLRVARARLAAAEAGVAQARAALLPSVVGQAKYTHNYKEVTFDFSQLSEPTAALAETIRATTTSPAQAAALTTFEQQQAAAVAAQTPITIQPLEQLDSGITATVPLLSPSGIENVVAARATARSNEAGYEVTEASVLRRRRAGVLRR